MRVILGAIALAAAAAPAFAAIHIAPGPELGVGWPAFIGAIVAGVVIFLLGRRRV